MPIYAYRCSSCQHSQDILRKISDPLLTRCPACGNDTFVKQVTAAGFALKGSGWYVTDFRGEGGSKNSDGTASVPKTVEIAPSTSAATAPAASTSSPAPATSSTSSSSTSTP